MTARHGPPTAAPAPSRSDRGVPGAFKRCVTSLPLLGTLARRIYFGLRAGRFPGSCDYWETRYRAGRDSGAGSYGALAAFKADTLNRFVAEQSIESVVELGCGDGAQLALAEYPRYLGIDISPAAIEQCRTRFRHDASKSFESNIPTGRTFDLALSLDVIYHLVEDDVFDAYMRALFGAARRYVIVYSSNFQRPCPEPHVRHRIFTDWVSAHAPDWRLRETIANRYPFDARNPEGTSFADFYVFDNATPA